MTASDTPETDAAHEEAAGIAAYKRHQFFLDKMRDLERDRDRLAALIKRMDEKLTRWFSLEHTEPPHVWACAERETREVHAEIQAALGRGGK